VGRIPKSLSGITSAKAGNIILALDFGQALEFISNYRPTTLEWNNISE
jgi:hypothetical protein